MYQYCAVVLPNPRLTSAPLPGIMKSALSAGARALDHDHSVVKVRRAMTESWHGFPDHPRAPNT